MQSWVDRVRQLGGEHIEMLVVGNKTDLDATQRQVTSAEGEALAASLASGRKKSDVVEDGEIQEGVPYLETSALNGSNVEVQS